MKAVASSAAKVRSVSLNGARYINVRSEIHLRSIRMDKSGEAPMQNMPPDGNLTELGEKILVSLWKLGGVGKAGVRAEALKTDMAASGSPENLQAEITALQNLGFLEAQTSDGGILLSLTVLGLALLRQLEEDKLQELK